MRPWASGAKLLVSTIMTTPYHMQDVEDERGVLPEDADSVGLSDDVVRVSVDIQPPGGTSKMYHHL